MFNIFTPVSSAVAQLPTYISYLTLLRQPPQLHMQQNIYPYPKDADGKKGGLSLLCSLFLSSEALWHASFGVKFMRQGVGVGALLKSNSGCWCGGAVAEVLRFVLWLLPLGVCLRWHVISAISTLLLHIFVVAFRTGAGNLLMHAFKFNCHTFERHDF